MFNLQGILYFAAVASELPNKHVSSLVHAAQQGGVQVGESKVCDCSCEALQQRTLG